MWVAGGMMYAFGILIVVSSVTKPVSTYSGMLLGDKVTSIAHSGSDFFLPPLRVKIKASG